MYRHVVLWYCVVLHVVTSQTYKYVVPPATVEVLSPKGLRVSIPDSPGISLFAFHGNINEPLEGLKAGQMSRDVLRKRGDRWVFEDKNVRLKKGDVLYYWLFVIHDRLGYQGLDRSYTVTDSSEAAETGEPTCFNSPTRVKGQTQCSSKLIFEKYFTGTQIDTNTWSHEIQIGGSDLVDEFSVFNNDPMNSFLSTNNIVIRPTRLEGFFIGDDFLKSVGIRLPGCTSPNLRYCERQGQSVLILPPVKTSRLTTKNSFSFQYGIVEMEAKLPKGDWIVPELWLQPKEVREGAQPVKIVVGSARGNTHLNCQGKDQSGRLLEAGTVYGSNNRLFERTQSTEWSQDYHLYKVTWTPSHLVFAVDNQEIGRIESVTDTSIPWAELASFEENEFYITIGVHVGGIQDFPDSCISGAHEKPWRNSNPRRLLTFWEDRESWFGTWNNDSGLRIKHVKVWAL